MNIDAPNGQRSGRSFNLGRLTLHAIRWPFWMAFDFATLHDSQDVYKHWRLHVGPIRIYVLWRNRR